MAEEITMVPIPWRHVEDRIIDYLNEEYPQLKGKITSVAFTKDGIVVKHMKD